MKKLLNPLHFDMSQLKSSREKTVLIVDLIMTGLILLNLSWLVFDSLFATELIQSRLYDIWPDFTRFYATQIHPNFIVYDFIFVAIFLTELCIRWLIAIYRKTYHRWFFYPFIHWYDVLGCIPVGSFRWLRLLRVIAILYRLQRAKIIDLKGIYPYRILTKYLNIVMEEITNRVVVNVLDSVQEDISTGAPVVANIVDRVVEPRVPHINAFLIEKINQAMDDAFISRRSEIEQYINDGIHDIWAKNSSVEKLRAIPRIGEPLSKVIEVGVAELVYDIVNTLGTDATSIDTEALVTQISEAVFAKILEPSGGFKTQTQEVLIEALEVIKSHAKIQKWKQAEAEARMKRHLDVVGTL